MELRSEKEEESFFRDAAAGIGRGDGGAFVAAGFFRVEILVGLGEQFFDAFAFATINRDADAGRERRFVVLVFHHFTDAVGDALRFGLFRFRQDESKFIAAVARRGVDGAAMNPQNIGKATEGAAADEMSVAVIDFLQAIDVQKEHGEWPSVSIGALGFAFEDVEKAAVIGKASERIADGEMADLLEEAGVVQKCAAEGDDVAQHCEALSQHERRIQEPFGLAGGELRGKVEQGGGVNRAVKSRIFRLKAAAIPDERREKDCSGEELLGTREKSSGMTRDFRRQTAQSGGDQIRHADDGEKCAGDFNTGMAGAREKVLDEKGNDEKEGEKHAADPPGDRGQQETQRGFGRELKEKNTGSGKNGARKKETRAEDQRDAVLRALKTNESDGGKHEREQTSDGLEIAVQDRVGLELHVTDPSGDQKDGQKSDDVGGNDGRRAASGIVWCLTHRCRHRLGSGAYFN